MNDINEIFADVNVERSVKLEKEVGEFVELFQDHEFQDDLKCFESDSAIIFYYAKTIFQRAGSAIMGKMLCF